jgi:hypothetical protein
MSIATMTRLAATPTASLASRAASPTAEDVQETALEKITAFIPTEVIGIYVAGLAIFSRRPEIAATQRASWWLFSFCLLLVPLFVAVNVQLVDRVAPAGVKLGSRKATWMVIFGGVAFAAWAAALPESPFITLHEQATRMGAFAVIVLGALMPGLAQLVGLVPRS